jgi:Ran GTPase-activating protein (RanGAP) involved in mRNA processing and transport
LQEPKANLKYVGLIDLGVKLETSRKIHAITGQLALKRCRIESLCLNGNQIGVRGALALAQGLCLNRSVKILDLSRNRLGPKGCHLLCEALREPTSAIKSLDLSYNEIQNLGARSLSELLPSSAQSRLRELRLQGNKISGDGLDILFKALCSADLKILDLSQNIIQISILHQFRQFLATNTCLSALSFSGVHFFNERSWKAIC